MDKIKHICFITNGYPTDTQPLSYIFVDQLVRELADLGVKCTVVHLASLTRYFGKAIPPFYFKQTTTQGHEIEVFRPRYISFSTRHFWRFNTASWTLKTFTSAAEGFLKKKHLNPDALYGHFIYPSGLAVSILGRIFGIPAFCAVGEGEPWTIEKLGAARTRQIVNGTPHLFAVSPKAKRMLLDHGLGQEKDIAVFPNGVNLNTFHPMDRSALREKYGFPKDGFIVAFVGKFSKGKGISCLVEALEGIQDIYAFFLGSGVFETDPRTTLFKGQLPHSEIPFMLNAADIFVLPTLIEGCSNAIIEALACGLPVVSSNYEFNDGILNDQCSIRVDPLNVLEIRQAILRLKEDQPLRESMSKAALQKASQLDIHKRAQSILEWMDARVLLQPSLMGKE